MSKQQEALQLLDDLDKFAARPPTSKSHKTTSSGSNPASSAKPSNDKEAAEALAFLDEITQKTSEPRKITRVTIGGGTPRPNTPSLIRKSTDSARHSPKPDNATGTAGGGSSTTSASQNVSSSTAGPQSAVSPSSWGWGTVGSVWGTASAALQQARAVVDEQVKQLPQNEQAKKWGDNVMGYVKQVQLDKLGQDFKERSLSTLTGIMNVVAPPISEHEVIQVWLSHDMVGYDGLESIVYRGLARILEQVEGGDLAVNRGNEAKAKSDPNAKREMNSVVGLEAAIKLAQAEIEEQIKSNKEPQTANTNPQNPVTLSPVYMRIQPFTTELPESSDAETESDDSPSPATVHLQFLLHLSDPAHQISHSQVTQGVPASWLDLWEADETSGSSHKNGEWIEDMLVDVIRLGVEVIGQAYVVDRMGWNKVSGDKGKSKETDESEEASDA